MRGYESFNFPAFDEATDRLRRYGYGAISPAEMDREKGLDETQNTTEGFDVADALRRDTAAIADPECNGIVLLPGWENSRGARAERAFAEAIDKDVRLYLVADSGDPYLPDAAEVEAETALVNRMTSTLVTAAGQVCAEDHEVAATHSPDGGLYPRTEVVVTDPTTGGQKGSKLARFDLIPQDALFALAEHFGKGAMKYEDRNWERGYAWSHSFAALNRHLWSWWGGEDVDPETGSNHMTAVAWHALARVAFQARGSGTDTRP